MGYRAFLKRRYRKTATKFKSFLYQGYLITYVSKSELSAKVKELDENFKNGSVPERYKKWEIEKRA